MSECIPFFGNKYGVFKSKLWAKAVLLSLGCPLESLVALEISMPRPHPKLITQMLSLGGSLGTCHLRSFPGDHTVVGWGEGWRTTGFNAFIQSLKHGSPCECETSVCRSLGPRIWRRTEPRSRYHGLGMQLGAFRASRHNHHFN